ncbi:unnamed protein product [Linum tenue]|uniref:C-CAP/cofactor C-like domain-containing protein n=1 Tax=Linum tenue TaxID=586396 RepID=A0AAV0M6I1_9ROSI|nr:unnamed protein product [Linum tenue]
MQSSAADGVLAEYGSSKPMEASLQKKRQAMIDRLSNRHQSRTATAGNSTRSADDDNPDSAVASKFSESKCSIDSLLDKSSSVDSSAIRSHFDGISSSIAALEQLVAESSYSLPSYELRSALKSVAELKQRLENQSAELLPKKKFSFRNKSATTAAKSSAAVRPKDPELPKQQPPVLVIRESPGFRNAEEVTLTKNFRGSGIGEFTASDLDSCEVRLIGCINALFINRLRNCRVYTGPVIGSVLIEQVENCVFVLASHQIRIHDASGCDFYLRVRSRPIIEDCSRVRFAPYCLSYEGIEVELKEAGLGDESGNWGNVDDFKWLRAVQSPNWSVLEESQRIECFEIHESGDGNENPQTD